MPPTNTPIPTGTSIIINPPSGKGIAGGTPLTQLFTNAITIVFIAATVLVLVMLVIGALQWILSGGDKEAVGKARSRITHALVGLVILALAFVILTVVGQIIGFNFVGQNQPIPPLGPTAP